MRLLPALLSLSLLSVTATGCDLYSGGDDDCTWGAPEPAVEAVGLRNPQSGQCENFGGGGPDGCYEDKPAADIAWPDWASCYSSCDGLDADTCQATDGCRAVFLSDCPEGYDCTATGYRFAECWPTAPSGPVRGGGCSTLDAYECSRHDDCIANHYPDTDCRDAGLCDPWIGTFESCAAEREEPDPGLCWAEARCESLPPSCPTGTTPGVSDGCWTGYCIPHEQCEPLPSCEAAPSEAACVSRDDCTPVYEGVNCVCNDVECLCEDWVYQSCEG